MKKIYSIKKLLFVAALFFGVANFATAQAVVTQAADNTPQAVPFGATCVDGTQGGASSGDMTDVTFTVAGAANTLFGGSGLGTEYEFMSVDLEMTHTWVGDLNISLTKDGVTHFLVDRNGTGPNEALGNNSDLCDDAPYIMSFTPGGTTTSVSGVTAGAEYSDEGATAGLAGADINGVWTLSITDFVGGDRGELTAATINWSQLTELPCVLTCPADITVSTDLGICGADVVIDTAMVSSGCVTTIVNGCTDFDGAADLIFVAGELQESTVEITDVPVMLPIAGPDSIDITLCISGDFGDEGEMVTIMDEAGIILDTLGDAGNDGTPGIDCDVFCTSFVMLRADYDIAAADGILSFTVTGNPLVSDFCASNTITVSTCIPEEMEVMPLVSNDYTGTNDASGFYEVGTTTVTYTSQGTNGFPVTCSFDVTVIDDEAPTVNCPGDQVINLDAGECETVYSYTVAYDDNCGVIAAPAGDPVPVPGPFGTLGDCLGNEFTVACNGGNTAVLQAIDVSSFTGPTFLTEGCFIYDSGWNLTSTNIRLFCSASGVPSTLGGDVPVATGFANVSAAPAGTVVCVAFDTPYLVDGSCGGTLWLEVDAVGTGGIAWMGAECNGVVADGTNTYLSSNLCGSGFLSNFGFSVDAFFGYTAQPAAFATPGNPGQAESGEPLAIGTHDFSFVVEDEAGNTSECAWTVTVNEFPEDLQSTALACNDNVNISVDALCSVTIGADMFLEGGPYGCYDDYVVNIWPYNVEPTNPVDHNGATIDFSNLLGEHTYTVTDPNTGNTCWGNFLIEDKYAPTLSCEDLTIACTDDSYVGALNGGGSDNFSDTPGTEIASNDEFTETASISAAGEVESISLDLDISHTWIGDLTITLTSPDGASAIVFDGNCANTDNLIATFEDGNDAFDCGNPAAGNTYAPDNSFLDAFPSVSAGAWTLTVADGVGGDDGVLNAFTLEVVTSPVEVSAADIVDNCSAAGEVAYTEEVVDGDCTTPFASQIIRTWSAVDASGNESPNCIQTISITRETLASLTLPTNYDGLAGNNDMIECDAAVLNADGDLDPATYGAPGGVGSCGTIITYYEDVILPICDQTCAYSNSSYKVVRKWTILDWCTGEILEPVQILKVVDTTAPEFTAEIADMTVSTDIWGCGATIPLPVASATDNCTAADYITYTFSSTAGVQVGNTFVISDPAKTMPGAPVVITVTASDCCGNSTTTDFEVTVADLIPPVVVAETSRTVSLSTDGVAKAFAENFDDGSHDGCGPIEFFVKRMDNGSPCSSIDKYGVYPGTDRGHGVAANNKDDNKEFNEVVHFCCADVGNTIMVQFMVCDDANMDGLVGNNGDNCNSSMVEVEVQDKLAPQIICPADLTITCIDLAGLGNLQDLTDEFLNEQFGSAGAAATCAVDVTQTISGSDACGAGTIFRNFTATNSIGQTSTCTQFITVTAGPDNTLTSNRIGLDIENPVFAGLSNCNRNRFFYGDYCNQVSGCQSQLERWWCVTNDASSTNNEGVPTLEINCQEGFAVPEVVLDINGLCTEAGVNIEVDTFQFAGGACQKYLVHYEVIDQCVFDENYVDPITGEIDPFNSGNGYFELYLEIDAFDNEAPTPTCDDVDVVAQSCDGYSGELTVSATDNCTSPEFFAYQWRLDVGADDSIDFPASGWVAKSSVSPSDIGLSEFPIGTHRVYWIISDGCGNDATCSQLVTIDVNDKAPTPYCYDGLAVAVMPSTGSVELWASDFDAGSFDNCAGDLTFSMIPEQDVDADGSAAEAYGSATPSWVFTCDPYITEQGGVSAVIEVRVYVTDANGNWDYCTASLRLDDNFDVCPDSGTITFDAEGSLKTQEGDDVAGVQVSVDASYPEFPMTETVTGAYAFDLIENVDYTITPEKNDNHLNGITTLDIVLIQKHILGISTLESAYTLIAADVNNDCVVNGSDLVQLRKLLLGKYATEQFPNNNSWRFVESDYTFINPSAPCNFSEVADIFNLTANEVNNFTGVKVGDINGTANANLTMVADVRSNENLEFVVADQALTAGNTYTVDFLAKDFTDVYGFQYTLNLANANFVSVESGALNVTENNFGLSTNGIMVSVDLANGVTVADDAVLFSITLEATTAANLSDVVTMNSSVLATEAYVGRDLEVLGSDVVFRTNEGIVSSTSFELFQNEPNPFNGATLIGFEIPTSSEATLSVYDVTGKVLFTSVNTYAKGYNTVTINRSQLAATGVLYYKLENGENVATMKMIVIE